MTEKSTNSINGSGPQNIVIIGGGAAGLAAATEIRKNSDDAAITLISAEARLPYYRLSLTRFLAGEIGQDKLIVHPAGWYEKNNISLILGKKAVEIRKNQKTLLLDDNSVVAYDKLIIATGADPLMPNIQGSNPENVISVRKLDDAVTLLDKLEDIRSCICIGGGILGLETAGGIAKSGVKVTVLEVMPWLMPRQLSERAAGILKRHINSLGIDVKENAKIKSISGDMNCEEVLLETGEIFPAEMVVITAGIKPDAVMASKAGLNVNKGIIVDDHMVTSEEDIYAAGDVAEHKGIVYGLWNPAQLQGKTAALNALGINSEFEGIPRSHALKVLGLDMFSIGEISASDESRFFEKETQNGYISFTVKDNRLAGGIIIGDQTISLKVRQAVEKGVEIPADYDIDGIIGKLG